eukprot:8119692-Prorocentrum_lima.AAC.1
MSCSPALSFAVCRSRCSMGYTCISNSSHLGSGSGRSTRSGPMGASGQDVGTNVPDKCRFRTGVPVYCNC